MLREILIQSWDALRRNPARSLLTMLGIVWGIVAVTLLMAYGSGFRGVLVPAFDAFAKSAVVAWPGQTSEQAGGERAGQHVRFELADLEAVQAESTLIKRICPETIRRYPVAYGEQTFDIQIRGVSSEYGEVRSEVAFGGRWLSKEDVAERRRVVFLGDYARRKLFRGRPCLGEEITIRGVRFSVIGYMEKKMSFGNYYGPDDRAVFIPYTIGGRGVGHAVSQHRGDSASRTAVRSAGGGAVPRSDRASGNDSFPRTSVRSTHSELRRCVRSSTACRSGCRCCCSSLAC